MKRFFLIVLITGTFFTATAQKTLSEEPGQQFLYKGFMDGTVRMKNGENYKYLMNYNMISGRMVYIKNNEMFDMSGTERIDTVFLMNSKFVPSGNVFYEVIFSGPVTFFYQHRAVLAPAGTGVGYGGRSQTSPSTKVGSVDMSSGHYNMAISSDYVVNLQSVYWLRRNDNMTSFRNEKQFLKLFPEQEQEFKKFIKENHIKFESFASIVKLADFVNAKIK